MRGCSAQRRVGPMGYRKAASIVLPVLAAGAVAAGCSGATTPADEDQAPASASSMAPVPVTSEQAGRIATNRFGGRVLNVEPDTAAGRPSWEVEVADSREGRIEVDVAQADGAIVEMERD